MKAVKTLFALVFAAALLFFGFLAASPYLTFQRIKQAAEAEDLQALSTYVDYPALRENLKAQTLAAISAKWQEQAQDSPLASLGRAFAAGAAEKMIDALITPENIALALASGQLLQSSMQGKNPGSTKTAPTKDDINNYTASWQDWSHILVHKKGENKGYIFRRSAPLGWEWKLAAVKTE